MCNFATGSIRSVEGPMATCVDSSSVHLSPSISIQADGQVNFKIRYPRLIKRFCALTDAVCRFHPSVLYVVKLKTSYSFTYTWEHNFVYTRKKIMVSPCADLHGLNGISRTSYIIFTNTKGHHRSRNKEMAGENQFTPLSKVQVATRIFTKLVFVTQHLWRAPILNFMKILQNVCP